MKVKYTLPVLFVLLNLVAQVEAWPCPGDPPGSCYMCEAGVWAPYGNCPCSTCSSCVACYCERKPSTQCYTDSECNQTLCYKCQNCTCTYQCNSGDCCIDSSCVTPGHCEGGLRNKIESCTYDPIAEEYEWCCCYIDFGHCTTPCGCEESDRTKECSGGVYRTYVVEEGSRCGGKAACKVVNWRPIDKIRDMSCYTNCQQCCLSE